MNWRELVEPAADAGGIAASTSSLRPAAAVVKRLLEGGAGPGRAK